jgi:hypothetical protein
MRTGLLLGDLHCGSMFAPCPEGFVTHTGSVHQPNICQRYLNTCWHDMCDTLPALDWLVLAGDMVDGEQPKDAAHFIWETDALYQIMAALELLKPVLARVRDGGAVYILEGSRYHTGIGALGDEALGRMLGVPRRGVWSRKPWLLLNVDGITLDIAHRQSMASVYPVRVLESELQAVLMRAATAGEVAPYAVIRHHTHNEYLVAARGLRVACAVPAWQVQTHYAQVSVSPNRLYSAYIGSVLVHVEAERLRRLQPPVWFEPILYEHPRAEKEELA